MIPRETIGQKIRDLRRSRRWTQSELAERLDLSQARLSELERGGGSFSAEQLLEVLRLFNVSVGVFEDRESPTGWELQNALVRYGATHLQLVPEATVTGRFDTVASAIVEVLLNPSSHRLVTALAPVIVWSIDALSLPAIQFELALAGVPNRLAWTCENTTEALRETRGEARDAEWQRRDRRSLAVLESFVPHLKPGAHDGASYGPDPFDRGIRSKVTMDRIWEEASPISRRWNIASALTVEDFARALRSAHESRP